MWALNFLGIALALYVFMADTIGVAGQGTAVVRKVLPTWFNWPLFAMALALMAAPIFHVLRGLRLQPRMHANKREWEQSKTGGWLPAE